MVDVTVERQNAQLVENQRLLIGVVCCLVVASVLAAGGSFFFPELLHGTAVTDGNLRGTALVVLALGAPLAVLGLRQTVRGDVRGLVVLLAGSAYLTYQGTMFCFGTPFNSLFLTYVGMLGLGVWSLITILVNVDLGRVAGIVRTLPVRAVSAGLVCLAGLNALGWLSRIVPALANGEPASGIRGSGLLTSPVWVQDLAVWIPAVLVSAVLMRRRHPAGSLLAVATLIFYVIESLRVASDQWWGVRADSEHPALASMTVVPGALVAAVVIAVPVIWSMRHLSAALIEEGSHR